MFCYFSLHFIYIRKSQDSDSVQDIKFVFANKYHFVCVNCQFYVILNRPYLVNFNLAISIFMGLKKLLRTVHFTISRIHIQKHCGLVYSVNFTPFSGSCGCNWVRHQFETDTSELSKRFKWSLPMSRKSLQTYKQTPWSHDWPLSDAHWRKAFSM